MKRLRFGIFATFLLINPAVAAPWKPAQQAGQVEGAGNATPEIFGWQYAYDDAGRVVRVVDPGGKQTDVQHELDESGRVRGSVVTFADGAKVSRKFDRFGRLTEMQDAPGAVRYEYDGFGRPTAVLREGLPALRYEYDTMDRVTSVGVGETHFVRYSYDFLGRLAKMETPAGPIVYEYQGGTGQVVRFLPNGIRTVWEYDPNGSLASVTHVARDDTVILEFKYVYRADGLISQVKEYDVLEGDRLISYEYDSLHHLTAVTDAAHGKTTYTYDQRGNLVEIVTGSDETRHVTSTRVDWLGRMTEHGGQECRHDQSGNLTLYSEGGEKRECEYDGRNLLRSVLVETGKVEYGYDGDGFLISRATNGAKTSFVLDPSSRIWRPLLINGPAGATSFYVWEGASPLLAVSGGRARVFLHDGTGSVRAFADQNGGVVRRRHYEPYGLPRRASDDSKEAVQDAGLAPGYSSLFYDQTVQVYLTRARVYDPRLGRFWQAEPLPSGAPFAPAPQASGYQYAQGDPINYCDLDGMRAERAGQTLADWLRSTVLWVPKWETMTPRERFQDFLSAFKTGRLFGTRLGEEAAEAYADFQVKTGNPLFAVPGTLASLWTTETWWKTAGAMSGGVAASGWAAGAGPTVSQAASGALSLADNLYWKALETAAPLIGSGVLHGSNKEPFHLPLLPDAIRYDFGNPHIGLGRYGWHLAADKLHLYGDRVWHPLFGSIPNGLLPPLADSARQAVGQIAARWPTAVGDLQRDMSPMLPSPAGGVSLRGVEDVLKGLGLVNGFAIDPRNNQLVLLSERESKIQLPPLRMDDLAAVFRAVFLDGAAPLVSIDPDPQNPEGPTMKVRHDPATDRTYVGWDLFEADRMMKVYSLGKDNITGQSFVSGVCDYQNLLQLGAHDSVKEAWERFWIVPAAVRAKQTADGRLTLFEVPLKVNTQRMVLEGGKLQPAPNQAASESSRKFAEWFTTCYDKISEEQWGTPPPESGLTQRVPVYEELRRFAFLTAVAEGLRNQGYPLPSWIRDFSIQPFPTPPTTPSTTVESGPEQGPEGFRTRKIYGGVNLAANDRDRHTEQAGPQIVELFNRIASASPTLDMTQPPVDIRVGDNWYGAKRLPVNHSPNVGANLLYENDLTVSLGETGEIGLRRVASSAIQTRGILGNAWTLDLPRLEKRRQPVSRDETVNRYATYFELTTPLNTYSEVFKEIRQVPEVNGRLMVPVRPGETLGLADSNDPQVGVQTRELLFRDGRSWHFDRETGELLAKQERGLTTIFSRDQAGRIVQIEGRSPAGKQARIQLRYDAEGRLSRAEGTDQSAASYRYEGENLVEVITPAGAVKYGYADGLVTSIVQDGKTAQEYAYGNRGELIRERGVGREETLYDYNVDETTGCVTVRRTPRGAREPLESARYDAAFRPLELKFADGARARWRYDEAGGGEATITFPQGDEYRVALSTDRRALTLTMPQGGTYALELDSSSQPALLREGSRPAVRRESRSAPGFDQITYESSTVTPEGEQAGHPPTAVFVIPAGAKGPRHDRWMRLNFDEAGRPREVKDYSGTNIQIAYDSNGSLRSTTTVRKGKPVGFQVARDSLNRITSVRSPWGEQLNQYDPATGALAAVTLTSAGQQAGLRFDDGKLISMHGFDNAEIRFAYFNEGPQNGLPREIRLPDNAVISYEYDPAGRVAAVRSAGVTNQYSYDSKGRVTAVAAVRETQ